MLEPASAESVPLGSAETAKVLPFPLPGARAASATVLLVGNPNVGKSLLFKNLTHRYVNVSNFPGTTVEITKARATFQDREIDVVDSPGVNDLSPRSDDAPRDPEAPGAEPGRDRGSGGGRQEPAAGPAAHVADRRARAPHGARAQHARRAGGPRRPHRPRKAFQDPRRAGRRHHRAQESRHRRADRSRQGGPPGLAAPPR